MDARGRSVNKNDAKKRFVTKASDNHLLKPMEIEHAIPHAIPHYFMCYNSIFIRRVSVITFRVEKFLLVTVNESEYHPPFDTPLWIHPSPGKFPLHIWLDRSLELI